MQSGQCPSPVGRLSTEGQRRGRRGDSSSRASRQATEDAAQALPDGRRAANSGIVKEEESNRREADMPANAPQVAETRETTRKERMRVRGEELLGKVRELIHEGNTRRIIVIGDDGTTLLEIPLSAGIVGTVMAPALVAVGAIAALASNYTLLIEARGPASPPTGAGPSATGASPGAKAG